MSSQPPLSQCELLMDDVKLCGTSKGIEALLDDMPACSSNLVRDVDRIKKFQRLATRMFKGFHNLDYEERLGKLDLFSMSHGPRSGE